MSSIYKDLNFFFYEKHKQKFHGDPHFYGKQDPLKDTERAFLSCLVVVAPGQDDH